MIARGLLCIGVATLSLAGGLAVTTSTLGSISMIAKVPLDTCLGEAMKALGGNMVSNLVQGGITGSYDALAKRLADAAKRGRLPENHDLVRALRRSQLDATRFLVETYAERAIADAVDYDPDVARRFRNAARNWLARADKAADKGDFFIGEEIGAAATLGMPETDHGELLTGDSVVEWLWHQGSEASLAELGAATSGEGVPPPQAFLDWYTTQYGPGGFAIAAQQFFAERLKTNDRVRTALFQGQLQSIGQGLASVLDQLSRIDAGIAGLDARLADRFASLEAKVDKLLARQPGDPGAMVDALLHATTQPQFREALDSVFGAYCPHDEWQGSLASKAVADRIAELLYRVQPGEAAMPAFFGREDELAWIDDWVEGRDRGLLVVCAPSGGGKSALLARWCERRLRLGDRLARHFISIRAPITTSPAGSLQHVLTQLREIDRRDQGDREAAIPSDEKDVINAIHARLKVPAIEGQRLIIVIDAMDELDAPFTDCFVRSDLAAGNYVIVSRRAEADVTPSDLLKWTSASVGDGQKSIRRNVPAMRSSDVTLWLEEFLGDVPANDMDRMAEKLTRVTDGLPLFLRFVIQSLVERFAQGLPVADRVAIVMSLRDPFVGFLQSFIDGDLAGVEDRMQRRFTQAERRLMSILSQAIGPISESELAAVFDRLRGDVSGLEAIDIAKLDHRLTRWLSVRDATSDAFDSSRRLAFDHPRLASEFAVVFRNEATVQAKAALIKWAETAWQPQKTRFAEVRGANYPVRYLPQHLVELGEIEGAARVMVEMDFIAERFMAFPVGEAAELMKNDWARWGEAYDSSGARAAGLAADRGGNR